MVKDSLTEMTYICAFFFILQVGARAVLSHCALIVICNWEFRVYFWEVAYRYFKLKKIFLSPCNIMGIIISTIVFPSNKLVNVSIFNKLEFVICCISKVYSKHSIEVQYHFFCHWWNRVHLIVLKISHSIFIMNCGVNKFNLIINLEKTFRFNYF